MIANHHFESAIINEDSAGLNLGQLTSISGLYGETFGVQWETARSLAPFSESLGLQSSQKTAAKTAKFGSVCHLNLSCKLCLGAFPLIMRLEVLNANASTDRRKKSNLSF